MIEISAPDLWMPPKPAIIRPASRDLVKPAIFGMITPIAGGGIAIEGSSFSYLQSISAGGGNTFSQGFDSFGSEASNRYIFAVVSGVDVGELDADLTVSCTIGSVIATLADDGDGSRNAAFNAEARDGGTSFTAIFAALVPTDVSKTVGVSVAGFSGTMIAIKVSIYRATNLNSATPTYTDSNDGTVGLTVPANGFGLMSAAQAGVFLDDPGTFTGGTPTTDHHSSSGSHGRRTAAGAATMNTSGGLNSLSVAAWAFAA